MQDRPICFKCRVRIDRDPIYEAPCGHDDCASAVFHGLCLMEFREMRESHANRFQVIGVLVRPWVTEHSENEES